MTQKRWTLATLLALGGAASADVGERPAIDAGESISVESRSVRGVAEDYLVMPSGGELAAQMQFITADPMLGGQALKFTDLALFGLSGRWSLFSKLELSAQVDLLAEAAVVQRRETVAERGRRAAQSSRPSQRARALGRRRSPALA